MDPPVPFALCPLPPQPVTVRAPSARRSNPKAVQTRRLGTKNMSRHPSASPPIRSAKSGPFFGASAMEEPRVLTVSVAFTTALPVMEAVAGTEQVGIATEDEPPETEQLNCTVPVNPPAGRMVSMSVTDCPAAATDTVVLAVDNPKVAKRVIAARSAAQTATAERHRKQP